MRLTRIEKFDILLHENGILENIAKKGKVIDVEDVKLLAKTNLELAGHKAYVVLIDSEELTSVTKEAMDYTSHVESSPKTIARALMVNNLHNRIVGNFYIKVKKPRIKTRLFNDKSKAMEWLEEQLSEFKLQAR